MMTRASPHAMLVQTLGSSLPTTDEGPRMLGDGVDDPFGLVFESVSELTARIKQSLKSQFGDVALRGEVSNVARPKSGHVYLTLKDDVASIRAVIWKSDMR